MREHESQPDLLRVFCLQCGRKVEADEPALRESPRCPFCGAGLRLPEPGSQSDTPVAPEDEKVVLQVRWSARGVMFTLFALAVILILLLWLLTPMGRGRIKDVVLGSRAQAAVEALRETLTGGGGQGGDSRGGGQQGDGTGRGRGGATGSNSGGQSGEGARGNATGGHPSEQVAGGRGARPRDNAMDSPANPQIPRTQPADAAPEDPNLPEQSIGRLESPDTTNARRSGEIRAGAAGSDEPLGRVGNTNLPAGARSLAPLDQAPNTTETNFATPFPAERSAATNTAARRPPPQPENVALLSDDFSRRLAQAGARSGDVQVSLMWNNVNDLDLHVMDPRGEEIYYQHRQSRSGGLLDVDMNAARPLTGRPVENVYWPERAAPPGTYRVFVNHYRNNGGRDPTQFTVRIAVRGELRQITGAISFGTSKRLVQQFTLPAN